MYTRDEKVLPVNIEDEMSSSFMEYAMSTIVSRALPDVRDGLKPVHRRILFAMHELGLGPNRSYRKCARIVGDTMGKYHPHGDDPIYESLVRMAQDFNSRYRLVDGQGNFGSIDGDGAAAMRYTEARLTTVSAEILADIGKNTVDMMPNFDNSLEEPSVLPSAVPTLLVNGSSGIAVGMATNMAPHNLAEITDALIMVINNPETSLEELMTAVPGPDFPTGGLILGKAGITEAYETGRGKLTVRARVSVEKAKKDSAKESIIITEIPFQVNKSRLLESIAALVRNKRIDGITDLRDESDRDGMRIVIELRRGVIAEVVLNNLYSHTSLQDTFGIIMLALVDNRPRVLDLKSLLQRYLDHRCEIVTRRTQFDLDKADRRAHIVEGLKVALDNIDRVVEIIRGSRTPFEAQELLITEFSLSEEQAKAILDMRLQRLTGLEREKLDQEYEDLLKEISKLKAILESRAMVLQVVREDLLEIKKKYADERRTEILEAPTDFQVEDLIAEEDMVITISHTGYIKRLPVSTYRKQRRGGRGVTGMGTKEEDFVEHLFIASTHHYILFFTDRGRVYWLKVHEIPRAGRLSKGRAIVNMLNIGSNENVTAFVSVKDLGEEGRYLVMVTEKGIIKKAPLGAFSNPRSGGIIALSLDDDDRLIKVRLTNGSDDILIGSRGGKAIRFHETDIRPMGRSARGVVAMRLGKETNGQPDRVIGMELVSQEDTILVVTKNGYGKRTGFDEYRIQNRGGRGIINIKTSKRNGPVVGMRTVRDRDDVMLITAGGNVVRSPVAEISVIGRNTQGVRVISLEKGDELVSLAVAVQKEEEVEVQED